MNKSFCIGLRSAKLAADNSTTSSSK